jgi:hypothetical protein
MAAMIGPMIPDIAMTEVSSPEAVGFSSFLSVTYFSAPT